MIRSVDEFVLFDDMQFTKRDWRSRNRIKTPNGLHWLTVPVDVKGKFDQRMRDARVADPGWSTQHWRSIRHSYCKTPYFNAYEPALVAMFDGLRDEQLLSQVNHRLIAGLCGLLAISTPLTWSMDYPQREGKSERLVSICQAAGATRYLSGPAARDYVDLRLFAKAGIEVVFADYSGYPEYPQPHGAFEHAVTVLDLLFNVGPEAPAYMKRLV